MVIKNVILEVLKKSIRDLLQSNELIDLVEIEDSTSTQNLCSSIEALFLYGQIKNKQLSIFSRLGRNKHSYDYDFWNFIKGYIPKNLLNVLQNSSIKFTPVGLCRVWVRYALNECTIMSYMDSILGDTQRLEEFYTKESLIRDIEMMETFRGMLTSIERIPFNLNTNSSLLNTWINSDALKIAGIIVTSSTNRVDNDANSLFDYQSLSSQDNSSFNFEETEEILTTNIIHPKRYSSSVPQKEWLPSVSGGSIDESISSYKEMDNLCVDINIEEISDNVTNSCELDTLEINHQTNENDTTKDEEEQKIFENHVTDEIEESLSNIVSSILDENPEEILMNEVPLNNNLEDQSLDIKSDAPINKEESYDQVWGNHVMVTQRSLEEVKIVNNETKEATSNADDTLESPSNMNSKLLSAGTSTSSKVYSSLIASKYLAPTADFVYNLFFRRLHFPLLTVKDSDQPWEFIGDEILAQRLELTKLMEIFPGADVCSSDNGLNSVFGGLCSKCERPLESGKAMMDHYDGRLFCTECESFTKAVIPRNIIHNWDFEPKFVSETTKRFLSEIMSHPNINLANYSSLFDVIPELARVRQLRHKLNLLWLQVTSCDIETSTKVRETMFPREYMLGNVLEKDLYSLEDLIIVQRGILEKTLLHVINKIAIPHVKKCLVCRMKAMACDKCRDEKRVIYIHEIDEYCECSTPLCKSVIHKTCKNPSTVSFYCRRCVQYLENQQPITLASFDTANYDN